MPHFLGRCEESHGVRTPTPPVNPPLPITSRPLYLMDKEGKEFTNGINKSDLAHDLLKLLNKDDILVSLDDYYRSPAVQSDTIMIYFMGVIRRRTAVELRGVETFGDLFLV